MICLSLAGIWYDRILWMWPWGVLLITFATSMRPTDITRWIPITSLQLHCAVKSLEVAEEFGTDISPPPRSFFWIVDFPFFARWDLWSFPGKYPYLKCLGIDFEVFRAKVYGWKPKSSQGRRCWMNLNPLVWNGPLVRKDFPKSSCTSSWGSRVPENSMAQVGTLNFP